MSEDKIKRAEEYKKQGNEKYKRQQFQQALYFYNLAINLNPNNHIFYLNSASAAIRLGKIEKAIQLCKKSLEIKKTTKGYTRLSQSYLTIGKIEEAEKILVDALAFLTPENVPNEKEIAQQKTQVNREREKVERIKNNIIEARQKMGTTRANLNLQESVKFCNLSPEVNNLYLENLILMKKFKEGIDHLNKIWNIYEDKSVLLYFKGKLQYYQGDKKEGENNLKRSMRMNPDFKHGVEFLKKIHKIEELKEKGNQLFKSKKFKEACDLYDQAMNIDPMNIVLNSAIAYNKCACQMKMGDYKLAKRSANKAIELNKDYYKAYLARGTCNIKLEMYEKAVHDFSEANRIKPSPEIEQKLKQAQSLSKKNRRKDYYKLLELEKECNDQDLIRRNYKKLARKLHPDRYVDPEEKAEAEEKFKLVNEAFSVLSDPQKKKRYDMGMDDLEGPQMGNMADIFEMFGGGGGGGGFPGFFSTGGGFPGGGRRRGGFRQGGGGGFPGFFSTGGGPGGGTQECKTM